MIFIVGRTATGKDTLANLLSSRFGLKQVISKTTRPRRVNEGNTHHFIKESDLSNYPNPITTTQINGYTYFITLDDLEGKQVYIIDPIGLNKIKASGLFDGQQNLVIYLEAPFEVCKDRYLSRGNTTVQDFLSRYNSESDQFSTFLDTDLGSNWLLYCYDTTRGLNLLINNIERSIYNYV